jgi:hypothetical protein
VITAVSRDLRQYAKQTQTRLIFGFLLLVFLIGDGLIFLFFGRNAGLFGLICIAAGLTPVVLIVLFLWIADLVVRKGK